MRNDTCRNCGYDRGLHHYQTMQCPVGGEAPIGRKQEWMTLTYQAPDERDATLAALTTERNQQAKRIKELEANNIALLACVFDCEVCDTSGMDESDEACHACGGYGFVVRGDIHEVALAARQLVSK